jgi:hypothetical protein
MKSKPWAVKLVLVIAAMAMSALNVPGAQNQPAGEIGLSAAAIVASPAVEEVFGPSDFMSAQRYLSPEGNTVAWCLVFQTQKDRGPVTVIASARRDDTPLIMMWHGLPKHEDPAILAQADQKIRDLAGVKVSRPRAMYWMDIHELWLQYPELNPRTGEPILFNPYRGTLATWPELTGKWSNRMRNVQRMRQVVAGTAQKSGADGGGGSSPRDRATWRADYIDRQWNDVTAYLAKVSPAHFHSARQPLADWEDSESNLTQAANTKGEDRSITVTYPNQSGITWERGRDYTIRWTHSGFTRPHLCDLKIELYKAGSYCRTIASSVAVDDLSAEGHTYYTWWVPNDLPNGADYQINLTSLDYPSVVDLSDSFFTIGPYYPPPPHSQAYIQGVPNLDQLIDQGQLWNSDCGIVAAMDIVLYWDRRGYNRLVDGGNLAQVREDLRRAMKYDPDHPEWGTTDPNTVAGLRDFLNSAQYGNQYDFTVVQPGDPMMPFLSYIFLASALGFGPAMIGVTNYTNDPLNPTDYGYGNHWMCAVGWWVTPLFPNHSGFNWVIVHDNWGGGTYANPDLIDDEPYIDWARATDIMIEVIPPTLPPETPTPTPRPMPDRIKRYLLGLDSNPTGLDLNGDGKVDIADLIWYLLK